MHAARLATLLLLGACGGGQSEPPQLVQQNERPSDDEEVHRALVGLHKRAVEECFGGFGKGAPYAAKLAIGKGTVLGAEVTQLSWKHAPLPTSCIVDKFVGQALAATTRTELQARFAVLNPDCKLPSCPADDRECSIRRDIGCSVVIDR
jgi:hypothetical protein